MSAEKELRLIVRIAGKDLDGRKPISHALTSIKGIGIRYGQVIAKMFEKKTGIKYNEKLGKIDEEHDKILEDIIFNPTKYNIPEWMQNRRKEFESGVSTHKVMSDLDLSVRNDIKRLQSIKSYRGIRHSYGLPVRGQRTRSSFRKRGGTVGVYKKAVSQPQAKKEGKK